MSISMKQLLNISDKRFKNHKVGTINK